jgi:FkbM family methyltransferase
MQKKNFNFYGLDELNQKEAVNGLIDCYVSEEVEFKMVCANNDCAVSRRFYWNNCYEKKTLDLWSSLSKLISNKLIIDIGAHAGVYSLCASISNNTNQILSFEPFFMNYARMSTNYKINNLNPNNLFMLAVGDANKQSSLKLNTNIHYLSSGGSLLGKGNYEIPIQEISIDSFIKDNDKPNVGLIKIDVEGYEANVMNGLKGVLKMSEPIIFFECNEEAVAEYFNSEIGKRYFFYEVDDKELSIKKVDELIATKEYFLHNRVAIPKKNNEIINLFSSLF